MTYLPCLLAFALTVPLTAQSFSAPVAAMAIGPAGTLISVRGVMGSLLLPQTIPLPPELAGQALLSASFIGSGGAVKSDSEVLLFDGAGTLRSRQPAPPGPALFASAPNGSLTWTYFAESKTLRNVNGVEWPQANEVVALGSSTAASLLMLNQSGAQLWAATWDAQQGAFSNQTPIAGRAPAVYFEDGWLVTGTGRLVWSASGITRDILIPEPVVELRNSGAHTVIINRRWILTSTWKLLEVPARAPLRFHSREKL